MKLQREMGGGEVSFHRLCSSAGSHSQEMVAGPGLLFIRHSVNVEDSVDLHLTDEPK